MASAPPASMIRVPNASPQGDELSASIGYDFMS
jgi:hypothetical protein